MAFDPSDPHARRSVVGRAALHGAVSAALTAGALHMVGSQDSAPVAVAGAVGAAVEAHRARQHNRETDAYEAQHGSGPAKRSVVGRTFLHGIAGDLAGSALGAGLSHLTGHGDAAFHGALVGGAAGRILGYVHGYRSAKRHNAMVDALVAARAKKQTVGGAVKNAQFEAKHRRIHGRFT